MTMDYFWIFLLLLLHFQSATAFQHSEVALFRADRRFNSKCGTLNRNKGASSIKHPNPTHRSSLDLASPFVDPLLRIPLPDAPALVSITITYVSLLLLYDRPRGSLPLRDALSIAQSQVPNAGLGLFVNRNLPSGTVLGTYPGVLRRQDDFYEVKCRQYPKAVYYSWRLNDSGCVLDPTDSKGEIQSYCYGGSGVISERVFSSILRFCAKPTDLTRINEPPVGYGGCNVIAREENNGVRFELCKICYYPMCTCIFCSNQHAPNHIIFSRVGRNVEVGEELFMDYGLNYDRSGYGQ